MTPRTAAGVRARFTRAGLIDLVLNPKTSISTSTFDGETHADNCLHRRPGSWQKRYVPGRVTAAYVLDQWHALPGCMADTFDEGWRIEVAGQLRIVDVLLDAAEVARAANRLPDRTDAKAGAVSKMLARIAMAERSLERQWPEVAAPYAARIKQALRQALIHLGEPNDAFKVAAGRQVRDRIVPEPFREWVTLDETPTLIGISPRRGATQEMEDVLRAFAAPNAPKDATLLMAPRYVVDYINRCYSQGKNWSSCIQHVAVAGISAECLETASRLWDPSTDGPMRDLATALTAAKNVLT